MVKAVIFHGPGLPISVENFSVPQLARGEVLISTIYSEVCGTDVHIQRGRLGGVPYPIIPGHISVGRVEAVEGEHLDVDGAQILPGDVVTFLDVHGTCNQCWNCLVAQSATRCPSRRVYGVTHSSVEGLLGGWSEKILLRSDVRVVRLPKDVSPMRFMAGGCALPTAIHAIERAEIRIGDTVVVQGAGPVGLCAALVARIRGAGEVFILDRSMPRLAVARGFGLKTVHAGDTTGDGHVVEILDRTGGRGADVVIEATGSPLAVREGIGMCRDGSTYVIVGHYTDAGEVMINPHRDINRKHLNIRGTWGIDFRHFYSTLSILRTSVGAEWESMIGGTYDLSSAGQALDDVGAGRLVKALIAPNREAVGPAAGRPHVDR